jgi:transcriptional regulator with XRE-family HTH domain
MTDEQRERAKEKSREFVGQQLQFWMNLRKMDRFELAERSGLSPDAIYKIGRGDRAASVDSLALLALGLGIGIQMFWMDARVY